MDLTTHFPRSPRERLAGIAMFGRTIDKARAHLDGKLGEYIFDCPMDKQLFAALGVDAGVFLGAVRQASTDEGVLAEIKRQWRSPSAEEISAHNDAIEHWKPKSDAGKQHFAEQRQKLAPNRPDITTWTDLIDIEEGRLAPA